MADRKLVKNRLRAKIRQRKKDEIDTVRKRELLETFAAKQGIVPTAENADPSKGDLHPVRLKLGYGPDGKPESATLEIDVPDDDTTVEEFFRREHVQTDIAKAEEDGLTVKILQKEGVKMTVRSNGEIGEAAMKQIFESIKSKKIPGIDRFFDLEDPGELAKRLQKSCTVAPRFFSGPSLEEKVQLIKDEMAKMRKSDADEVSGETDEEEEMDAEPKEVSVATKNDSISTPVELPEVEPKEIPVESMKTTVVEQTPADLMDALDTFPETESVASYKATKKNKKKNKKASASTNVPISCDNDISSDIDNDAQVVDLKMEDVASEKEGDMEDMPELEEVEREFPEENTVETSCLHCRMSVDAYPLTIEEHFEYVKRTFEFLKNTNMVTAVE